MSKEFDEDEDLDKLDRGDDFNYDDDEDEDDTTGTSDSDEDDDDNGSDSDENDDENSEVDEDEEVEEEVEKPKKIYIPKDRFDEVNKEKHLLQEQLDKVLAALLEKDKSSKKEEEAPSYDFDAAEEEYISLVIEGETKAAIAKRKEINAALEVKLQKFTSKQSESTDVKQMVQAEMIERDFKTLISTFESQHSFLNPKAKSYNEEAVDTVNTLMKGYLASGKDKPTALSLAVKKVIPMYTSETKVDKSKSKIGDDRKTEAGKKAVETAKQPSVKSSSKSNIDLSKVNLKTIKDKDLFGMSKDELRRMRGDFL